MIRLIYEYDFNRSDLSEIYLTKCFLFKVNENFWSVLDTWT